MLCRLHLALACLSDVCAFGSVPLGFACLDTARFDWSLVEGLAWPSSGCSIPVVGGIAIVEFLSHSATGRKFSITETTDRTVVSYNTI